MGMLVVAHHQWLLARSEGSAGTRLVILTNSLIGATVLAIAWRLWHGPSPVSVLGHGIGVRSLYTPVLVLTVFVMVRLQQRWRFRLTPRPSAVAWRRVMGLTA